MSAAVVLGVALGMAGCGGDPDAERAEVDETEQAALAAVDEVVHDVADATRLEFHSGDHDFVICGESYAPRGVIHRVSLHFGPPDTSVERAVEQAAEALATDGWEVGHPGNPAIVEGVRGSNTLRFHFGGAATEVSIRSSCVETSDDVANEYADRANVDIDWK
ncbi:MAG TPA: hypothetical protein VM575_07140 [Nocardioides sp.]|jgi:hypothetical protein|nr:hypothetical protein [Nocardioides sp.]